jgi:transposase
MTIPADLEAQILRYYHVEKWRAGTIATQLGVHRNTVLRVVGQAGLPDVDRPRRASKIDRYLPFIRETLTKFPRLTASRLYGMVRERGYHGGPDHFRHMIARHRPRHPVEAYLRLRTLPGEQAQVDWAHMGHLSIGQARRALMAFVMVLSFSRQIFVRFFLDARMENFLRGHVGAFAAWQSVPRVILYDNLRSVVVERQGDVIRFNPALLDFAGHYRFEPRPVAVARGNEKGRVERSIRYLRESFFAAREFIDVDDLNAQVDVWCQGLAADRRCPEQPAITVRQAFAEEKPSLLSLPQTAFPVVERVAVIARKTPYVRYDKNDYSIPHSHVGRPLTLLAEPHELRIVDGVQVLARHVRSYDKGAQIEDPAHIAGLVAEKRAARHLRGNDRLAAAAPASRVLPAAAAEQGGNLGSITSALLKLLDRHGAAELQTAIIEAMEREIAHPSAVRFALERRRDERRQPPPVDLVLPDHVQARDQPVRTHRLESYDQLKDASDE